MNLLYMLADAFVNTFGITRPKQKARKQAAIFIVVLVVLVLAGVAAAGYAIHLWIR